MKKDPWSHKKNIFTDQPNKAVVKSKPRWRILPILWMALKRTCTFLGAILLVMIVMLLWAIGPQLQDIDQSLPERMVLKIELDGPIGDLPTETSFVDPFSKDVRTIKNYIDALERAKADPRVLGVYAEMRNPVISLAHIEELRAALIDFRSSGKFAHVYSSSYRGGLGAYYIASAFDEIWMQPMGIVMLNGLNAEMPFMRDVLDKIGVEPQMFQRKEYKTAYENVTDSEISDENRETVEQLLSDFSNLITSDFESQFDGEFKALVDHSLFIDNEAFEAGLVDHLGYLDQFFEAINKRLSGRTKNPDFSYVAFDRYAAEPLHKNAFSPSKEGDDKPKIALIYAVGAIMDDDEKGNSSDDGIAGAKDISAALYDAANDPSIDEVVLRINSPGGSPVASEAILRAVEKVQDEGKTVTVSMGPVAASGGYWIAAYADEIFVLPSTITGSIGVLGGKVSFQKMWEMIGIHWSRISWGKNAAMWSMNTPFSSTESERMNAMLDNIYKAFVSRVAQGRDMEYAEADKISRGRAWSGLKAVELGLADQFGGLNDALDYAAEQVDENFTRNDVNVVVMPKPLSAIERFVELLDGQVKASQSFKVIADLLEPLEPAIDKLVVLNNAQTNTVYAPISVP